jgi:glycerophosphoryl diester phosphodiesterase
LVCAFFIHLTMLKIAHRGFKGMAPENTLIAFQKAVDASVDGIELDVHLSIDGHLMVIHDNTIDRTTNGKGVVNKLSLPKLKSFLIDGQHQIPTLSEVLELVNQKCMVNIELKGVGTAQAVGDLITSYVLDKNWNYNDFLVSSFDWTALQQLRFLNEKIPIGVLTETDLSLAFAFAKFMKAETIHPYYHLLTKENTTQMQEEGLQVFAWTINNSEDIQKIKLLNVNGIISDYPDKI